MIEQHAVTRYVRELAMSSTKSSDSTPVHGISYTTTLTAAVAAAVGSTPALAQQVPESDSRGIEEITVTASKRGAMSIMDLAGSIQAFDTDAIRNQNLFNMEDYSKFTPSLSYFGNQVGQGKIFFRGIADAPDTFIVSQSAAVYLDEQPVTQGAAVDVRLVDIERVEALSGPQGTLYGSSSQSGTLRIVTNKPDPTRFEAFVDASLKGMSEGDNSYDISGMVNLPLAEDQFAVRLVGFSATEGGFIDNVLGTTGACETYGRCGNGGAGQLNTDAVEEDWNETTIAGGRVSGKWFINDDWSATLGIAHQTVESDAENTYDPTVGDLQLIAFNADTFEDDWTQFALTVEGKAGNFSFTSATAYFTRESQYAQDTTDYAAYFGQWCYYFTATYNIYCFQPADVSYAYNDPVGFLTNDQENTSLSQEFRVAFDGERLDWVAGVFWEDRHEEWDFNTYITSDGGYRNSQAFANWTNPYSITTTPSGYYYVPAGWGVPATPTDAWWFSADDTDWETLAVFGEATFHLTDRFSVTAGARWFDVEQTKVYWVENPAGRITPAIQNLGGDQPAKFGCIVADAPCNPRDSDNPNDTGFNFINSADDDIAVKFSVQYDINEDVMVYGLYSEGFRAGGVNRNRGAPKLPQSYVADFLENTEFGIKGRFAGGRLSVSAQAFFQDWNDYQLEIVDPSHTPCDTDPVPPCGQPWQKGVFNAGNASSDGLELQIEALPDDQLLLRFNATFLDAELESEVLGLDGVGIGSPLPFAPDFKGSFYAQYNWPANIFWSNEAFVQLQYSYVSDSINQVQQIPRVPVSQLELRESGGGTPQLTQQAYDYTSLKFGLMGNNWEANVFVNNLFDERGQLYHDITDFEPFFGRSRVSVIRPREFGVRFFRRWE